MEFCVYRPVYLGVRSWDGTVVATQVGLDPVKTITAPTAERAIEIAKRKGCVAPIVGPKPKEKK